MQPAMARTEEKFCRVRVLERHDIAADLWKIRVASETPFRFVAGQYATLGVQTPEKLVERAYSIVSSPYEETLEFFIELVPAGDLTPLLFKLNPGDELTMRKIAKGRFTLDLKSGHTKHLLLCTVTGIAPFISYIRTLKRDWDNKKFPGEHHLYLLNAASRSWEFGYREEVEKVVTEVPWLNYVPSVSRTWEDTAWHGELGRVEDLIRKYMDQWEVTPENATGYLCGHPQMIEHGMGILKRRGFPNASLRQEVYWVPAK
jgi:ferredoxin/flavodoxin---NADP+ reductase